GSKGPAPTTKWSASSRSEPRHRSNEETRMQRTTLGLISTVVVVLLVGFVSLSQAAGPAGMKLYAFSSGGLTIAKSALQSGAPNTQVTVPVGFFVVKHPKGNFVFDTGNNDKIITDPSYWGPFIQGRSEERRVGKECRSGVRRHE